MAYVGSVPTAGLRRTSRRLKTPREVIATMSITTTDDGDSIELDDYNYANVKRAVGACHCEACDDAHDNGYIVRLQMERYEMDSYHALLCEPCKDSAVEQSRSSRAGDGR